MDVSLLFVPLSLVAGGLLAVQVGANAQLSRATGSPLAASAMQLAVGLVLLTTAAAAAGALGVLAPIPHVQWWQWFGGLASALYVTSAIVLFPRLGAVVTVGLFIAGQMLASLLLDGGGLIGVKREPIGLGGGLGIAAVLAGVALIVRSHGSPGGAGIPRRSRRSRAGWTGLALAAGAALPVQGAVNARLRAELGEPLIVGAVSFLVATVAMALLLLLVVGFTPAPAPDLAGVRRVPWWGWLGGCVAPSTSPLYSPPSRRSAPPPRSGSRSPASSSPPSCSTGTGSCACRAGRSPLPAWPGLRSCFWPSYSSKPRRPERNPLACDAVAATVLPNRP